MNVKPLIKVLNPFLLRAVSLFIASPTDLPQGLTEQKGFQPADRGKSWGLEQIWGRRGVNGRLGQPRPLQQRAGRSQTRHDKWLCPKTECKPKPTGSKKKISMGCIEESIYQEVSMKVSLLISNSLWISAWIHTFLYEHSYHTARRDTFRKEYFSPNNFLVWFFFFVCLFDGAFLLETIQRKKWMKLTRLFFLLLFYVLQDSIWTNPFCRMLTYMFGHCKELLNRH